MYMVEDQIIIHTSVSHYFDSLIRRFQMIGVPLIFLYILFLDVLESSWKMRELEAIAGVRPIDRFQARLMSLFVVIFIPLFCVVVITFLISKDLIIYLNAENIALVIVNLILISLFSSFFFGFYILFQPILRHALVVLGISLISFSLLKIFFFSDRLNGDYQISNLLHTDRFLLVSSIYLLALFCILTSLFFVTYYFAQKNYRWGAVSLLAFCLFSTSIARGLPNQLYDIKKYKKDAFEKAINQPDQLYQKTSFQNANIYASQASREKYMKLVENLNVPNLRIVETPFIRQVIWRKKGDENILLIPEIKRAYQHHILLREAFRNIIPPEKSNGMYVVRRYQDEWSCIKRFAQGDFLESLDDEINLWQAFLNREGSALNDLQKMGVFSENWSVIDAVVKKALTEYSSRNTTCPSVQYILP